MQHFPSAYSLVFGSSCRLVLACKAGYPHAVPFNGSLLYPLQGRIEIVPPVTQSTSVDPISFRIFNFTTVVSSRPPECDLFAPNTTLSCLDWVDNQKFRFTLAWVPDIAPGTLMQKAWDSAAIV